MDCLISIEISSRRSFSANCDMHFLILKTNNVAINLFYSLSQGCFQSQSLHMQVLGKRTADVTSKF